MMNLSPRRASQVCRTIVRRCRQLDQRRQHWGVRPSGAVALLVGVALVVLNLLFTSSAVLAAGGNGCTELGGSQPDQPPPCPTCGDGGSLGSAAGGSGTPECSTDPIQLSRGAVVERATDVSLPGITFGWSHTRSYDSLLTGVGGQGDPAYNGARWRGGMHESGIQATNDSNFSTSDIELYVDATSKRTFTDPVTDSGERTYTAPDDMNATLVASDLNSSSETYRLTDLDSGDVFVFYGLHSSVTRHNQGRLKERTSREMEDAGEDPMSFTYTSYNGTSRLTQVTMPSGWSVYYYWNNSGSEVDRVSSIEVEDDSSTVVKKVEYLYYWEVTSRHSDIGYTGDLSQVKVSTLNSDDSTWDVRVTQYRYHRNTSDGRYHQLKMVLEPDAIDRILAVGDAGVTTPEQIMTKADTYAVDGGDSIGEYANRSFTYYTSNLNTDSVTTDWDTENFSTQYGGSNLNEYPGYSVGYYQSLVKSETTNGGCGGCGSSGSGIKRVYYYVDLNGGPEAGGNDLDDVTRLVIEDTLSDDDGDGDADDPQFRTIYGLNQRSQELRKAVIEDPTQVALVAWCSSTIMGTVDHAGNKTARGRLQEQRMPSAHTGVTTEALLKKFLDPTDATNDADTLSSTDGVVYVYEYDTTYGATGYRTGTRVKEGSGGTAYYVGATDYGDGSSARNEHTVASYQYPTATTTRANGIATEYSYTYWNGQDSAIKTLTTTAPTITAAQNGPGAGNEATTTQYFDKQGRLRWTQDGEGYCTYLSYHPETGGLAYIVRDVNPASLPANSDNQTSKWVPSGDGDADLNKPTRAGGLPTAIAAVTYHEFDTRGRRFKTVEHSGATHYVVYESNRTLRYAYWDSGTNQPLLPIQVSQTDDAGRISEQYSVNPARTASAGGVPTGLTGGTDQSHYTAWTRYTYSALNGHLLEIDRYHDIPSSGTGTLSTNYDATHYQYDHMGRREYTIQTVSGTTAGAAASVEQVTQVVYDSPITNRVIETKAGVSSSSHAMTADYDTYPTLRTLSKAVYDDGGVGDGDLTQSASFHGTGANDYTGVNYHRDYRGRLRGVEPFHSGSAETAIGPFTVQDIRWDGRTTHTAVYDTNPTWATVLGDDDYADTIATNRRALSEVLYDDMNRRYRTKSYTVAESDGSAGSYFRSDTFYDRNSRVVASAPAYSAATEMAYDGLGRQYQTRTVGRLEGEPQNGTSDDTGDLTSNDYDCYDGGGAFVYCTPTPNPDFSDMTGTDGYVYALSHTEFSDDSGDADPATGEIGLPTRRYNVDQNGSNQGAGGVGVDFTNDDDYVVTYAYTYYDAAHRPVASINHGSGASTWTYGAEPDYDAADIPEFTDTNIEAGEALLATFGYDADTGRRNLVTSAIGVSVSGSDLTTIDTKTFHDDFGRTTHVAENFDNFTPPTTNIGDGSDDSKDRVTSVAYDGLGNVTSQTAYNGTSADDQVTEYLYEDPVSASRVTLIKYPDGNTTVNDDNINITYNTDGSINTRRDQRGVVLTFVYNDRRQLEYQDVTTLPGGVDGAVRSIGRGYDNLARLEKITSYDDVSTGSPAVVNEVQYGYSDPGLIVNSWQNHDGATVTSGGSESPNVYYQYDSSQTSSIYNDGLRLGLMDYPSAPGSGADGVYSGRRRVHFYTLAGTDKWNHYQRQNRTYGISETNPANGYSMTGVLKVLTSGQGRLAQLSFDKMDNPGTGGDLVLLNQWQTNNDTGLDRFGRTASITYDVDGVATHAVDLNYGYDAGSNRIYREDELASAAHTVDVDERYGHDDLSRLNNFKIGNVSTAGNPSIASPNDQQDWDLDPLGNWEAFDSDLDGTTDTAYELEQTRTANDANEIGTIAASTGTDWVDPVYDASGNMTVRADPNAPSSYEGNQHKLKYDAWNRLVRVTEHHINAGTPNVLGTVLATYEYDGLGRRIQKTVDPTGSNDTYDYYHSTSWQVLEVRKNGDTDPYEQFVYDGTYIDAPFMRYVDHNQDGDLLDADEGEHYFFRDASYNIVAYAGDDGTIKERYRYTPYGKRIAMSSAFVDKAGTDYGQQRGFQGMLHDEESGLIENRNRMLDPKAGRFLQRDPLGYPDGMNRYAAYHVMSGGMDPQGTSVDIEIEAAPEPVIPPVTPGAAHCTWNGRDYMNGQTIRIGPVQIKCRRVCSDPCPVTWCWDKKGTAMSDIEYKCVPTGRSNPHSGRRFYEWRATGTVWPGACSAAACSSRCDDRGIKWYLP